MNLRKHMGLVVGGGITLVLLIVAVGLLLRVRKTYTTVNAELQMRTQRLNALNQRDPFPSEENVKLAAQKLEDLKLFFTNLTTALQSGQVEPVQMEPAEFPPLLERTARELRARAATPTARVKLPDRFAFGFERYLLGNLPAEADIPRLVIQLKTVESICSMLFESRVSEVMEVRRTVFEQREDTRETEAPVDLRRRRVVSSQAPDISAPPEVEAEGLYGRERFELRFVARETALWELLNRMAGSSAFIVVVDLQLANKAGAKVSAAAGKAVTASAAPTPMPGSPFGWPAAASAPVERVLTHDERVVAGREEIEVRLVIDVYRFLVGVKEEATP
ncbi:MAG: Amuc_1100 family pilus-like protein [Kiritimatiellae bacterium]|nr:Amuc_1100 family pilus-like protein [Kiritimatiellia bacterium]